MKSRGFTFVTFLSLVAGIGAVYWLVTYGPAYWDNFEVHRIVRQAANLCYREHEDPPVRAFVMRELQRAFPANDPQAPNGLSIDFDPQDLRIERTEQPPLVNVWLTYHRSVNLPIVGGQRELTFVDHVEQDLSPVKW